MAHHRNNYDTSSNTTNDITNIINGFDNSSSIRDAKHSDLSTSTRNDISNIIHGRNNQHKDSDTSSSISDRHYKNHKPQRNHISDRRYAHRYDNTSDNTSNTYHRNSDTSSSSSSNISNIYHRNSDTSSNIYYDNHRNSATSSDQCTDELSCNTMNEIVNIIKECDRSSDDSCKHYNMNIREEQCSRDCPPDHRYDPGVSYFTSIIIPVIALTPQYSGCTGCVEFRMRRKNKTVTLQWEPFSGSIASSGISNLTVVQTICNTPPYPISIPIYIKYKDDNRITNITIDPNGKNGNIKYYLNTDGSGTGIVVNDAFYIYAGAVTWIVD